MYIYIILVIIIIIVFINEYFLEINENKCKCNKIENFHTNYVCNCNYKYLSPWWNSTRHTRNTSWDIRGDVPI